MKTLTLQTQERKIVRVHEPNSNDRGTGISRREFLRLGGAGLLLAPLLGACSVSADRQQYQVLIGGVDAALFWPGTLAVPLGATVTWQNRDVYPHTVTCDPDLAQRQGSYAQLPDGAAPWDSGNIYTGQMWSHTFTSPGQYIYFSRRDEQGQLLGVIIVGSPGEQAGAQGRA